MFLQLKIHFLIVLLKIPLVTEYSKEDIIRINSNNIFLFWKQYDIIYREIKKEVIL